MRIIDVQELASAKEKDPAEQLIVMVRPDFVVAAEDLAAIRSLNLRLDTHSREFASTPFGQRVAREYPSGITLLAAADIQQFLETSSPTPKQNAAFQRSGFADMQYLVWDHKTVAGVPISQMELRFSSPRHAAASWLAKPHPLGSLDSRPRQWWQAFWFWRTRRRSSRRPRS